MKILKAVSAVFLMTSPLLTVEVHANEVCRFVESDSDGDGWGFEAGASCRVTAETGVTPQMNHPRTGAPLNIERVLWVSEDFNNLPFSECQGYIVDPNQPRDICSTCRTPAAVLFHGANGNGVYTRREDETKALAKALSSELFIAAEITDTMTDVTDAISDDGATTDGDGDSTTGDEVDGDGGGTAGDDGDATTDGDGGSTTDDDGDAATDGNGGGTTDGDGDAATDGDGGGTTDGDGGETTDGNGGGTTDDDGSDTTDGNGGGTTDDDGGETTDGNGGGTTDDDGGETTDGDGGSTTDGDGGTTTDGDGGTTTDGDGETTTDGDGDATTDGDGGTTTDGDGDTTTDGDGALGTGRVALQATFDWTVDNLGLYAGALAIDLYGERTATGVRYWEDSDPGQIGFYTLCEVIPSSMGQLTGSPSDSASGKDAPACIDTDGDGFGWDGSATCIP